MRKRSRNEARNHKLQKRSTKINTIEPQDMDDEIDAFHKVRDMVPLVDNSESSDSDEDLEQPVLGNENIDVEFSEEKDEENEDRGLAAKIVKQQRYLRAKFGGIDEEMGEDEVEEEARQLGWGGKKARYHGGDNRDFELKSSDDEALKEEEEEILRLQREKAKFLSLEDFGISEFGDDGINMDPPLEDLSVKEFIHDKKLLELSAVHDASAYFKIPKDQSSLTAEEQMEIIKSSAPELVGLLLELKFSVDELDIKLNPFFSKLKEKEVKIDRILRYMEIKQLLLLSYSQAIVFYLILKSEGQPIRDHPILFRIVEIKELLNKMKDIEGDQPICLEDLWNTYLDESKTNSSAKNGTVSTTACDESVSVAKVVEPEDSKLLTNDHGLKNIREKHHVASASMEMLKIRAAFESKLKSKGSLSSPFIGIKTKKSKKKLDRRLETVDDYDEVASPEKERANTKYKHVVSKKQSKPKLISGDEDVPKRDDIGERRKRHELKVLAGARIKSEEDAYEEGSPPPPEGGEDSDDDLYIKVKEMREERLSAKSEMNPKFSCPSEVVDGKRLISRQIEKNRGLTRSRNKLTKNPRKKYRTKHDKAQKRRKGQVRDIKRPFASYGGETSGINPTISRSIRF